VLNIIFFSGKAPAEKQASFPERSTAAQISKIDLLPCKNHPDKFFLENNGIIFRKNIIYNDRDNLPYQL
jgi:hypothetical protein